MVKILVTGGAGFIGSHIVDKYVELGHEVVIVDNLSSGLKYLNPKAKFYDIDVSNMKELEEVFKVERPSIVNHQAAMNTWDFYEADKDKILFQSDVVGTFNVITLCIKYRVKKIIHASSAAVYGDHPDSELPLKENAALTPISLYGLSKLIAEQLITFYGRARALQYVIFRYANVYGPRQKGGAISIFVNNMLNNRVTKIYGGGKKTRDYVYIADVVNANVVALGKGNDLVLNIGTSKETSDIEIYELVNKILEDPHQTINVEDRIADIKRNSLSYESAHESLGWKPEYSIDSGLKETVDWYLNNNN